MEQVDQLKLQYVKYIYLLICSILKEQTEQIKNNEQKEQIKNKWKAKFQSVLIDCKKEHDIKNNEIKTMNGNKSNLMNFKTHSISIQNLRKLIAKV